MRHATRTVSGIAANLLFAVAAVLVLRIVVMFFHPLAVADLGKAVVRLTGPLVLPLPLQPIRGFQGYTLDAAATVTVVVVLLAEWLLGLIHADN